MKTQRKATFVAQALCAVILAQVVMIKAQACNNHFYSLPTNFNDGKPSSLQLITPDSADTFCRQQGFSAAGSSRNLTAETLATTTITIINLRTNAVCDLDGCQALAAVECLAAGDVPCTADSDGNIGRGNVGRGNFGIDNVGTNNWGLRNIGENNIGVDNAGKKLIGISLAGDGHGQLTASSLHLEAPSSATDAPPALDEDRYAYNDDDDDESEEGEWDDELAKDDKDEYDNNDDDDAEPVGFFRKLRATLPTATSQAVVNGASYTISISSTGVDASCNGRYLGYSTASRSSRPYLISSAATKPPTWRVRALGKDTFVLETASRATASRAKLSFSPDCSSTNVKLSRTGRLRWRLVPVDRTKGLYRIATVDKACKVPVMGLLAPKARAQGSKCGTNAQNSVSLMPIAVANRNLVWRFKRVLGPTAPPSGPLPPSLVPRPSPSPVLVCPPSIPPPPSPSPSPYYRDGDDYPACPTCECNCDGSSTTSPSPGQPREEDTSPTPGGTPGGTSVPPGDCPEQCFRKDPLSDTCILSVCEDPCNDCLAGEDGEILCENPVGQIRFATASQCDASATCGKSEPCVQCSSGEYACIDAIFDRDY